MSRVRRIGVRGIKRRVRADFKTKTDIQLRPPRTFRPRSRRSSAARYELLRRGGGRFLLRPRSKIARRRWSQIPRPRGDAGPGQLLCWRAASGLRMFWTNERLQHPRRRNPPRFGSSKLAIQAGNMMFGWWRGFRGTMPRILFAELVRLLAERVQKLGRLEQRHEFWKLDRR